MTGPIEGFNPTRFGRSLHSRQIFADFAQRFSEQGDTRIVGGKDRRLVARTSPSTRRCWPISRAS